MVAPLFILDSYALIYRSYYAFINRPLINKKGENVSAVFGFFRTLKAALDHYRPQFFVCAFDSVGPTFRHEMFDQYKATRAKTPEDLHTQIPVIEDILAALGLPVIRVKGFEADDIIATLVRRCEAEGRGARILTGDKDLMQLVSPGLTPEGAALVDILRPDKTGGSASGWEAVDAEGVRREWGVGPELMLDMLSLTGDTADNIPGVPGVGDKTALKLLTAYGTLDGIFEHASEITGALGNKIRDGKESAYFSRTLITLREDVPLDVQMESMATTKLDYAKAGTMLSAYDLPTLGTEYSKRGEKEETKGKGEDSTPNGPSVSLGGTVDFNEEKTVFTKNSGDYRAVTDLQELRRLVDGILDKKERIAAFDLETDRLDTLTARIVGFSLCTEKGRAVYVPLILPDPLVAEKMIAAEDALDQVRRLFTDADCTLIMHNGKFDYEVLRSNGLDAPKCFIVDTMVAAWLVEPDRGGFGLEALARGKLGLETIPFKELVAKGQTFADVPLDKAVPYGAEDADLTWQLWEYYRPRLEKAGLEELFWTLEMPLLPILGEMEIAGIHIEKEELFTFGTELTGHITQSERDIFDLVGHEFNIASTKQLQEVLFVERGLQTGKKTKTGFSTDTGVLEELSSVDPVARKILEYRSLAKLKNTYVDALPTMCDTRGRIHTNFMQTGTATGRLSSRDPNLQNIPIRDEEGRRIRTAFAADAGMTLISADYAQIELVILAHLSGDENLCGAFMSGQDVHKATAALIFGVDANEVTPDMRRVAKTINFGVMYGMSSFRLAGELGIPRTQAASFLDAYTTTYAGVQRYFTDTIMEAEKTGYVETLFGRRRYLPDITSSNKVVKAAAERVARNTPIQGTAADIVKKAMIALDGALKADGSPAKALLQVHDELIFECPEGEAEKSAAIIKDVMEGVVTLKVPLRVSVETGKKWGDFH